MYVGDNMDRSIKLIDREWFQELPQEDYHIKFLREVEDVPDVDRDYVEIYQAIMFLAMKHIFNYDMCEAVADHFNCEHSNWQKYGTDEGSWEEDIRELY